MHKRNRSAFRSNAEGKGVVGMNASHLLGTLGGRWTVTVQTLKSTEDWIAPPVTLQGIVILG